VNHRTRFDAADNPLVAEREHGGHRFHHQFAAFAVCKYDSAASGFAPAAVATARARGSRIVLWIVPDDVVVESVDEVGLLVAFLREGVYSSTQSDGW